MVILFDMGATRARCALMMNGDLGDVYQAETNRRADGIDDLIALLKQATARKKIEAVIGGVPGQIDAGTGRLASSTNLPKWKGLKIGQQLEEVFDCPVYIYNDVTLGGLGECHFGAGTQNGVMAYFTVSTGVNTVRIVDGAVDESIGVFELGRQVVAYDGQPRTLESIVGGAAMQQRLGKPPNEVRDERVWRDAARDLALSVYNTALYWAPEVIVFGGSMMRDIDLRLVENELAKLPDTGKAFPRLEYAKLRDIAGLYGARVRWSEIKQ